MKNGYFKKADQALNGGKIADLYKNNNWNKTKSKFPNKIRKRNKNNNIKPKWNLNQEQE